MLGLCLEYTKKCGGVQYMQEVQSLLSVIATWNEIDGAPETQLANFSKYLLAKFRKKSKRFEKLSENFWVLFSSMQEEKGHDCFYGCGSRSNVWIGL